MHLGDEPAYLHLQPADKCVVRSHHLARVPLLHWLDHDCVAVQIDQHHGALVAVIGRDGNIACLVSVHLAL